MILSESEDKTLPVERRCLMAIDGKVVVCRASVTQEQLHANNERGKMGRRCLSTRPDREYINASQR